MEKEEGARIRRPLYIRENGRSKIRQNLVPNQVVPQCIAVLNLKVSTVHLEKVQGVWWIVMNQKDTCREHESDWTLLGLFFCGITFHTIAFTQSSKLESEVNAK